MVKKLFDFKNEVGLVFKKGSKIANKAGKTKTVTKESPAYGLGTTVIFEHQGGLTLEGLVCSVLGDRLGVEVDGYEDLIFINSSRVVDEK